ncbi:unnamed protein product [Nesidiocoris tenuis]|uniref:Uncharacterized protein n=1 Tax=Nesidiocoris tenuis TaxID=355587 RepID=A0A6H5G674_9HEMI|nr:unnamed protein product [Nesidiocoris tenuis]
MKRTNYTKDTTNSKRWRPLKRMKSMRIPLIKRITILLMTSGCPSLPEDLPEVFYSRFKGCLRSVKIDRRNVDLMSLSGDLEPCDNNSVSSVYSMFTCLRFILKLKFRLICKIQPADPPIGLNGNLLGTNLELDDSKQVDHPCNQPTLPPLARFEDSSPIRSRPKRVLPPMGPILAPGWNMDEFSFCVSRVRAANRETLGRRCALSDRTTRVLEFEKKSLEKIFKFGENWHDGEAFARVKWWAIHVQNAALSKTGPNMGGKHNQLLIESIIRFTTDHHSTNDFRRRRSESSYLQFRTCTCTLEVSWKFNRVSQKQWRS